jgi:hypothetical protein
VAFRNRNLIAYKNRNNRIDDVEPGGASPALAAIGYVKSIVEGDKRALANFESTFGKEYMGFGNAMIAVSVLTRYVDDPLVYAHQFGHAFYRHAYSPSNRAARDFMFSVCDMFENSSVYDENGDEIDGDEDPSRVVRARLTLMLDNSKHFRVPYIRGSGYAVANLINSIARDAQVPEKKILAELHHAYLSGGTANA